MAATVRVECINKTDRYDPHERIQSIGGRNSDGTRWKLSQADAIAGIDETAGSSTSNDQQATLFGSS